MIGCDKTIEKWIFSSVNHGVPGSSPGGGAKQNPIRCGRSGFFVPPIGREVYPDATK